MKLAPQFYVVRNYAGEIAGYFTNAQAAQDCADYNNKQYNERWTVIAVHPEDHFKYPADPQ